MRKLLWSAFLGVIAVLVALSPANAVKQQPQQQQQEQQEQQEQQPEQQQPAIEQLAGTYEFETPDYGIVAVDIALTEDKQLTVTAMGSLPQPLKHVDGLVYEVNSPDYGLVSIGFVAEKDGTISAITIDSTEFSFIAPKKKK